MDVVIIGPFHPFRGGIADTDEALARSLQGNGHRVECWTFTVQYPAWLFPGKTQYSPDPVPEDLAITRRVHAANPFNWLAAGLRLRRKSPDLVILRFWIPFIGPCLGTLGFLAKGKTRVVGLCDNIIPHEARPGDKLLTRYFLGACHGFATMSHKVQAELKSLTSKPEWYAPHPINDQLPPAMPQDQARQQLGLSPEGPCLLFFGLIRPYKGLDLLLEALADPRLVDRKVTLLVAGECYEDPARYTDMIDSLGLKDRVVLRNEFIPTADMPVYFSAADMVVLPYRSASQSGVTQVAYHYDCPMLVTDVGGLAEFVPDGKAGYVTPPTPKAMADAVEDFYLNDRSETLRAGVRETKAGFRWERFAEGLTAFATSLRD